MTILPTEAAVGLPGGVMLVEGMEADAVTEVAMGSSQVAVVVEGPEEVDEDQYHDAERRDDDEDGGGGGGGQGEDALYAQWLQNFRDENDTDPDWAN